MKKQFILMMATASLLLTACNQAKPKPSDKASGSTAPSSSQTSSSSSTATESASQELYQAVLDQYQANGQYGQYAFYDLDKNGTDELLLGQDLNGEPYLGLLYYLKGQEPTALSEADVASGGGHRSSLTIYQDGQIIYESLSSYNGDGSATLYKLKADNTQIEEVQTASTQVGQTTAEDALGLTGQAKLDLKGLTWQKFDSQAVASGLNIDAISKKDYSSLSGTWTNGKGETLVFDELGIAGGDRTLSTDVVIENGYLKSNVVEAVSSYEIVFAPAGITLDSLGFADASDSSKDRIWAGQSLAALSDPSAFYYKVD